MWMPVSRALRAVAAVCAIACVVGLTGCAGSGERLPPCRGTTACRSTPAPSLPQPSAPTCGASVGDRAGVTSMRTEPEVTAYFEAARGWDLNRAQAAERSAQRAWLIAAVATLLTVLALVAVAGLTPMKTVEPFVIRVDDTTGVVDVVPVLTGKADVPEAVTRYFVTQYVQVRERYVAALAESDYEQVGAYHSPQMNQAWAALWNRNHADSPLNRHADGSSVRVQVNAVSFLKPASGRGDLVQVRFVTERAASGQGSGAGTGPATQYVATLQYAYGPPSTDDRLRAANPLGFKVLEYRKEPEVLRAASASLATAGVAP